MARNRLPTAVQVNGVALLVKDPEASSGLFTKFQRVPGLANFTLPDETGSTNETQLQDGAISFAQVAGVGTITGSIGAITGHPTHQFLAGKRRSGGNVTITIVRPAIAVEPIGGDETAATRALAAGATAADKTAATAAVAADGKSIISVKSDYRNQAKARIREGMIVALTEAAAAAANGFIAYDANPQSGDQDKWRSVLSIDEDGSHLDVAPGFQAVIEDGSNSEAAKILSVRRSGVLYSSVSCSVNGFGDGDFQAGGAMAANISFAPAEALPVKTVEHRLLADLTAAFDGALGAVMA